MRSNDYPTLAQKPATKNFIFEHALSWVGSGFAYAQVQLSSGCLLRESARLADASSAQQCPTVTLPRSSSQEALWRRKLSKSLKMSETLFRAAWRCINSARDSFSWLCSLPRVLSKPGWFTFSADSSLGYRGDLQEVICELAASRCAILLLPEPFLRGAALLWP